MNLPISSTARRLLVIGVLCLGALSTHAATAPRAEAVSWENRWYGSDALFNRDETNMIKHGYGIAGTISGRIPHRLASKALKLSYKALKRYATWVYDRGGCLKLRIFWNGQPLIGHYFGGYCHLESSPPSGSRRIPV